MQQATPRRQKHSNSTGYSKFYKDQTSDYLEESNNNKYSDKDISPRFNSPSRILMVTPTQQARMLDILPPQDIVQEQERGAKEETSRQYIESPNISKIITLADQLP